MKCIEMNQYHLYHFLNSPISILAQKILCPSGSSPMYEVQDTNFHSPIRKNKSEVGAQSPNILPFTLRELVVGLVFAIGV